MMNLSLSCSPPSPQRTERLLKLVSSQRVSLFCGNSVDARDRVIVGPVNRGGHLSILLLDKGVVVSETFAAVKPAKKFYPTMEEFELLAQTIASYADKLEAEHRGAVLVAKQQSATTTPTPTPTPTPAKRQRVRAVLHNVVSDTFEFNHCRNQLRPK